MTKRQDEWFARMRREWLEVMKPLDSYAVSSLFPPVPIPDPERFAGCTLLPNRTEIVKRLPPGGVGAEVGTQEGYFAKVLLEEARPSLLHLFDIDDAPLQHGPNSDLLQRPDVQLHLGDSSTVLSRFRDDYFDWIYVDGDHSYEGVKKDTAVARTKVKPGGLLIFNDFTMWSVAECIDYGVPHAVCELSSSHDFQFVHLALHPHFYNDVALRRPSP